MYKVQINAKYVHNLIATHIQRLSKTICNAHRSLQAGLLFIGVFYALIYFSHNIP
jgi:hypothetical protein